MRSPLITARARGLRRVGTPAERALWAMLLPLRQQGYHFRRQVPFGPYYADIACHHARLVIEADGATHDDMARDSRRDAYMQARGYRVLRFWNNDIMSNPDGVFSAIAQALAAVPPLPPTPNPSPQGGGGPRRRKLRTGLAELAARTGDAAPAPLPLRGGGEGRDPHATGSL